MLRLLVLHGPNSNLLGTRENKSIEDTSRQAINEMISRLARELGLTTKRAAERRGIGDPIQQARAAWTVSSSTRLGTDIERGLSAMVIAAVLAACIAEVHLSNIHQRGRVQAQVIRIAGVALG
ncbi:MAG: type II 3-dehydroquinate dehydratase [Nitrospiraceae bacterium]